MLENHPGYFAAANTPKGFRSYFSEIFDPDKLNRIYIIKGGPGTGKSGLMRAVAGAAEEAGLSVERFSCSSDPKSLDGVLLPEKGVALLDGTSPHTVDPSYPGAVDCIVNTGSFWDVQKLLSRKREIISLIREGKRFYKRAYGFLSAAGEICEELRRITKKGLNEEKMRGQILRLEKNLFSRQQGYDEQIRVLSTFNENGLYHAAGFLPKAKKVWLIRDPYYLATSYLCQLATAAREAKQSFVYCPSCLFPEEPDALYFPRCGAAFVIENETYAALCRDKEVHILQTQRFLDKAVLRANTQKLRFGKRCVSTLLDGAAEAFREASEAHGQLERSYVAAMDFSRLNLLIEEMKKEILSL